MRIETLNTCCGCLNHKSKLNTFLAWNLGLSTPYEMKYGKITLKVKMITPDICIYQICRKCILASGNESGKPDSFYKNYSSELESSWWNSTEPKKGT